MTRIADPHAGEQLYEIKLSEADEYRAANAELVNEVKLLRDALRAILDHPQCPPHIAVIARTTLSPRQG